MFDASHNGPLCSKFVAEKLPIVIKNNLMFWDKRQQPDIEQQENLFEFVKNVLEAVSRSYAELPDRRP